MIYFPANLTPVPGTPGYFWNVETHKLYSLKVGGELREMKRKKLWGGVADRFPRHHKNAPYYTASHNGRTRYLFVADLKKLKLEHYDIPVVHRNTTPNPQMEMEHV